jgi:hypothetical protein
MSKAKRVVLEISTWRGISIGAQHYYGKLHWYDADDEYQTHEITRILDKESAFKLTKQKNSGRAEDYQWFDYEAGDESTDFDSRQEIRDIAIATYKEHYPEANMLQEGRWAVCDPQEVIDADDKELMKGINWMYERAEEIGWYEGDYDEMMILSNAYCKLVDI